MVPLDLLVGGIDREHPGASVEHDTLAALQLGGGGAQADDGGQPERPRQNRDVRRPRAGVRGNGDDRVPLELDREARREIVRDENRVRARWEIDRIVIRQAEQQREHANVHVGEIADALAQHRRGVAGEARAPLEHHEVERLFRADVLADELLDAAGELAVVENGELHVEDRGFFGTGRGLDARSQMTQPLLRTANRLVQPLDLAVDGSRPG